MDCSSVPEKAEGEQESEEEVEEVGATLENAVYGAPKQSRGPGKKGGRTRKGDENKASSSQSKGKGNKKAQASPPDESAAVGPAVLHRPLPIVRLEGDMGLRQETLFTTGPASVL